jgi:hypothetical protein
MVQRYVKIGRLDLGVWKWWAHEIEKKNNSGNERPQMNAPHGTHDMTKRHISMTMCGCVRCVMECTSKKRSRWTWNLQISPSNHSLGDWGMMRRRNWWL